ncbi:DEAD/DEAH box helicase [Candidatus Poribacteria bacterium]|nr:DEAD/DEAH box helicase [Candidatus Poribacteria bacterium]
MKSNQNKQASSSTKKKKPIKLNVSRTHQPDNMSLEEWQRILRKQYSQIQKYKLQNIGAHPVFSEFSLTNPESKKTYKIAIRGDKPGDNYCSCPDYNINNLGTCKHIEFTLTKLKNGKKTKKVFKDGYCLPYSEVYLTYGINQEVRIELSKNAPQELILLTNKFFNSNGILKEEHITNFLEFFKNLPKNSKHEVRCYDDVLAYIALHEDKEHRRKIFESELSGDAENKILNNIIKTKLYPYQCEGALFAAKAGRCLIGDDMGLGKTIQALAACELMAKLYNVKKVLIVSPTSLKYQWQTEIEKFTSRTSIVLEGMNLKRSELYKNDSFYKITNYELVYRDIDRIREWAPDLIILDEAQRIKNWKTRTAKYVKQLNSTFAIVLTGTPIENRIEELHSIMQFIDPRSLGPLYKFIHEHRIVDEGGKVIGYQNLQSVRETLKNFMIRRKKNEVLRELPERIDKYFFVPMTKEQMEIHDENYDIVVKIVAKWRRFKFLSEADHRRLQIALNFMRMAADNTYLVDKKTIHGPKIEELEIILKEIIIEGGEKVVIFSQWLRMTELVEHILNRNKIGYVHLNGSVPGKERKGLMSKFKEDPACKVFLSTDAGGVGLNLQSGSVVINMDIPWNPAILEQRIGRVHRLGQQKTVRVINFVSSCSIESRILELLKFKKSLFSGALDSDGEDIVMVGESQLKKFMQSVETVAENLEKSDPSKEEQEQIELEQDNKLIDEKEKNIEKSDEKKSYEKIYKDKTLETLNNFLTTGAQLLMNLSKIISEPDIPLEKHLSNIIDRDEKTGKSYLKIPLPETENLKNIFSNFGELIANAMKG